MVVVAVAATARGVRLALALFESWFDRTAAHHTIQYHMHVALFESWFFLCFFLAGGAEL